MNLARIKNCLEINKIWFETIAAVLISSMAIIVSIAQWSVMEKQALIAERQYQSEIDPVISIGVENLGMGENGVYKLKISNIGALDICNVQIYEFYLTCPCERRGQDLSCDSKSFAFSSVPNSPIKTVLLIRPDDEVPYSIDIKKYIANTQRGEEYPCFLRLRIDYQKKVDGKKYRKLKAYGISNILMDLESDAIKVTSSNLPHFEKVRDLLLNNF
ncbi:MAG: hypothetical protein KJ826_00965 [Proteobacteria bacterium]|nr:hypothetical protein [Pseudomonadota bacterium]